MLTGKQGCVSLSPRKNTNKLHILVIDDNNNNSIDKNNCVNKNNSNSDDDNKKIITIIITPPIATTITLITVMTKGSGNIKPNNHISAKIYFPLNARWIYDAHLSLQPPTAITEDTGDNIAIITKNKNT